VSTSKFEQSDTLRLNPPATMENPMSTPDTGPLALVIEPDGRARTLRLPAVHAVTKLNELVGGYITAIAGQFYGADWIAYVNEEGHPMGLPPNRIAGALSAALGWRFLPGDYLAGAVVFLGRKGVNETDVPAAVLRFAETAGLNITPTEEGNT
jgi:hypothetical protein